MKKFVFFLISVIVAQYTSAQKKPLDHSVYDAWEHIGERMISNDGRWIVYTVDPQEGDNQLVVLAADGTYKRSMPRGYNAVITEDSRYLICRIKAPYKDSREAKIRKRKPEDMPRDSLCIIELLNTENTWKREKVTGFKTPQKSAGWVAYMLDKQAETLSKPKAEIRPNGKANDSLSRVIDSLKQVIENMPKKGKKKKDDGDDDAFIDADDFAEGDEGGAAAEPANDLVLRNLSNGQEKVFSKVLEYYFSKTGGKLLLEQARNPADSGSNRRVVLIDLQSGDQTLLSTGGNDFRGFTMNDEGTKIAYVGERDARPRDLVKYYKLWYYQAGMDSAVLLVDRNMPGMKLGMTVSEYGTLGFSRSGNRLFFGSAPVPVPRDTSLVEMDMPKMDIWHYKDDYLQTVQLFPARLRAAQQENFLSVYQFDTRTIRQLGSRELPQVIQTKEGDGDIFVGVTDFGKRVESQWLGTTRKDIYVVNANTGEKKRICENLHGQVYPSPSGSKVMWYDRVARQYFIWDGQTTRNVTARIKVPLYQEDWDTPDAPANYGIVKWEEEEDYVLVNDRFGIWKVHSQAAKEPVYLLGNREKKYRFRYLQTDPEERFLRPGQSILLSTFDENNKFAGLWRGSYTGEPTIQKSLLPLHADDGHLIGPVQKAKNADHYLFTLESFTEPADLYHWYSTEEGPDGNKISAINPQQSGYLWGSAELFRWKAYNGKEATGIVYKPENFDPKKKYPMIVYFYEKLSDGLFDYKEPAPIRSAINVPYFVSNGYIIFIPDIEYKTGYPGQGAYDYIVSGARAIVKRGWADSTLIGIQGHSWGGYQAAQLATMTKLFKAVWAGAPVANMTSAYGGIRWESGVNRQFQYEKTQSRIGATLWERQDLYLKNSPLFQLNKVTAPMVIMHNDADGAVPWYQGIELFTALRRLGKPVWMFNYNGQGHGLTQRQDMRDYQIRMQQFFDYMLKGAKPTRWITEGVPAVRKGKDWGLD